jgi:folate-binding protein YgfZ
MNTNWKQFLKNHSATFDDSGLVHFPQGERTDSSSLFSLNHLGLIKIAGEDAVTFMQGQFTNDSRNLSPEHSQLSALCTPKGRMQALFRIIQRNNDFYLLLPHPLVENIIKRLSMFVLRTKVTISDASSEIISLGLVGTNAHELIEQLAGKPLVDAEHSIHQAPFTYIRLRGSIPRYLILAPEQNAQKLWTQLSPSAHPKNSLLWKLFSIQAGEPSIYPETSELFVPQMLNLQAINGLSFTKGCYTGQEVVARMQYLGKLKRRMYRASVETSSTPNPGDQLFSSSSTSGQGAGRIVEAALLSGNTWEILAVIENQPSTSEIHLNNKEGPLLKILDLPYDLEEKPSSSK